MRVKNLIELLLKENPEAEVIMSRDSEGNSFGPLADTGTGFYVAETTWSGELYEDAPLTDHVSAVVLWPTN
jgi:hypothetical protein